MGVCNMGVDHPQGIIKNIVPIVMAGVLGIYGLIVSVIITQAVSTPDQNAYNTYSAYNGYTHVRVKTKQTTLRKLFSPLSSDGVHNLHLSLSLVCFVIIFFFSRQQFAAGLCCGLSCLAAGGTIGVLGDAGVRAFGLKASAGRKWFWEGDMGGDDAGGAGGGGADDVAGMKQTPTEAANKLYVGMLIMLIFSEALALYGLIVALILSQHNYVCSGE